MLPRLTDSERQRAISRLHQLAARHRTEAAALEVPGGFQRLYGNPLGVTVPDADRLGRLYAASARAAADRADREIRRLLAEPSDAAHAASTRRKKAS